MKNKCLLIAVCLFTAINTKAQKVPVSIIPQPLHMQAATGQFILTSQTRVFCNEGAVQPAGQFAALVKMATGYAIPLKKTALPDQKDAIVFLADKNFTDTAEGAYAIDVSANRIVAKAANETGLFYALQSLRQLLPPAVETAAGNSSREWAVPCVKITDAPRYRWRGFMLDVSRTFYSVAVVKKYLDAMALYKLNTFHFHLTDDQGWRMELKSHPEMTSARATTFKTSGGQPAYRSGFYTQAQLKEIVKYAADRHITIVPEIDVPGHCWPITLMHPELCVNGKNQPDSVPTFMDSYNYWGYQYTPNPLDPTKEKLYAFLNDVFIEVAAIFPGKYIHFGGDEVRHELWQKSPAVQQFMKEKGFVKTEELQSYFVQRVSRIIESKGKVPLGWNDILADATHLPKNTAIMSWLGSESVKEAAKFGFYTVATPSGPLYFDISQRSINDGTMVDWNYGGGNDTAEGGNTLEKVYNYNPDEGLTAPEKKYVLGVQANMWPSAAQEVKDMNVQVFPRLLALAETAWTQPENKSYAGFAQRLAAQYPRLDSMRLDYFTSGGYIISHWDASQTDTGFATHTWDVTPKVYAAGRAQAGFLYTGGASFLKVKNVKLLENGAVVARDDHASLADKFRAMPFKKNMFFYILQLPHYNPKAAYTLQADVAGETGRDSRGNITFSLSPDVPFAAVEAMKK